MTRLGVSTLSSRDTALRAETSGGHCIEERISSRSSRSCRVYHTVQGRTPPYGTPQGQHFSTPTFCLDSSRRGCLMNALRWRSQAPPPQRALRDPCTHNARCARNRSRGLKRRAPLVSVLAKEDQWKMLIHRRIKRVEPLTSDIISCYTCNNE